jgi:NAD(P)-dependent dehydrogenase (short-subunit alcohol dehydrogenase family)
MVDNRASSGLGYALAEYVLKQGDRVVLVIFAGGGHK